MGKWAKGATKKPLQHITDPGGFAKRRWNELKGEFEPEMPEETPEERSLRNRQALELTKLDEDENRRIKSMFSSGGGRRLFKSARAVSGTRGSAAAPSAPSAAGAAPRVYGGSPTSVLP